MKRIISLLLVMCLHTALAQQKDDTKIIIPPGQEPSIKAIDDKVNLADENTIYNSAGIGVKPQFPGGMDAFYKEFWKHFRMANDSLKGRIFVSFTVEKDGSLSNMKVLRDIGFETGSVALKAIQKMPKWQPGRHDGKVIRCQWHLPITIPYEPNKNTTIEIRDK